MSDPFDDLLFPRGQEGLPLPYAPEPTTDDTQERTHADLTRYSSSTPVNIGDVFAVMEDEREYRRGRAVSGTLDLWTAGMVVPATLFLEAMQTEAEENPITAQMAADSHDWMINLATTPYVDWKAFGTGVAAWALVSAAGRMRANFRYPAERDKTVQAIAQSDGFIPHTVPERRKERRIQRAMRAAGALVAGIVTYKFAEQQSITTDMWLQLGLMGTAVTTVTVSEVRANRHTRHQRREGVYPQLPEIES